MTKLDFKGACFGARLIKRPDCPNDLVQLLVEDDGNWIEKNTFDAGWIDDLIAVLRAAQSQAKVLYRP